MIIISVRLLLCDPPSVSEDLMHQKAVSPLPNYTEDLMCASARWADITCTLHLETSASAPWTFFNLTLNTCFQCFKRNPVFFLRKKTLYDYLHLVPTKPSFNTSDVNDVSVLNFGWSYRMALRAHERAHAHTNTRSHSDI